MQSADTGEDKKMQRMDSTASRASQTSLGSVASDIGLLLIPCAMKWTLYPISTPVCGVWLMFIVHDFTVTGDVSVKVFTDIKSRITAMWEETPVDGDAEVVTSSEHDDSQ